MGGTFSISARIKSPGLFTLDTLVVSYGGSLSENRLRIRKVGR